MEIFITTTLITVYYIIITCTHRVLVLLIMTYNKYLRIIIIYKRDLIEYKVVIAIR